MCATTAIISYDPLGRACMIILVYNYIIMDTMSSSEEHGVGSVGEQQMLSIYFAHQLHLESWKHSNKQCDVFKKAITNYIQFYNFTMFYL